jgi:hypothetical protein
MRAWNNFRLGLIGCGAFGESYLATLKGIPFVEVACPPQNNSARPDPHP